LSSEAYTVKEKSAKASLRPQVVKQKHVTMRGLKKYGTPSIIPIFLLLTWQILSSSGFILQTILPSPIRVLKALIGMILDGTLWVDLKSSGIRVFIGFFWGTLIGLSLGIASGMSHFIQRLIEPVIDVMRQIPLFAWIPLIVLWFGVGEVSKDVIIAKAVFVPVYVNTLQGILGVDKKYVEVARALELSLPRYLGKVVLPSSLPFVFTGLRLGAGFAWMAVVAAEMLGSLTGLGYALLMTKDFLQSDKLIALMAVIGLIGFLVDKIIKFAENSVVRWNNTLDAEKNN
jgi:sulfonate transport system permease protein